MIKIKILYLVLGLIIGYVTHYQIHELSGNINNVFSYACGSIVTMFKLFPSDFPVAQKNFDVVLYSQFKPLILKTSGQHPDYSSIAMTGLLGWQKPHRNNITLKNTDFIFLLPPDALQIRNTWYMVEPFKFNHEFNIKDLSKQYQDNVPVNNTAAYILHNILTVFHQNVFMQTRFAPRGTIATLRAYNSDYMDIVFRCHAEFQLNNPPLLPFWFTPAQFQSRLIISKNISEIKKFKMMVPSNRKLNVDMEWINRENDAMEVDIGYVPEMTVQTPDSMDEKDILWDEEMSLEEAHELLARTMFPFKEVAYLPIEEVIPKLNSQGKLFHCIVLWGALDDQSC